MKHVGKFIGLMLVGLVVVMIGAVLIVQSIPGTGDFGESTGSTGGLIFGLLFVGVGEMVFLIGTIALGVFLGTHAANSEREGVGRPSF